MRSHEFLGRRPEVAVRYDRNGLQVLDLLECYRLLAQRRVARVAYTDRAMPAIAPLTYRLDGQHVVFGAERDSRLARCVKDAVVALEVDHLPADEQIGWSIIVVGVARPLVAEGGRFHVTDHDGQPRPDDSAEELFVITPSVVTGRRLAHGVG